MIDEKEVLKSKLMISYAALEKYKEYEQEGQLILNEVHRKMFNKEKKGNLLKTFIIVFLLFRLGWSIMALLTLDVNIFEAVMASFEILKEVLFFEEFFFSIIGYAIIISIVKAIYGILNSSITYEKLEEKYKDAPAFKEEIKQYQKVNQEKINLSQTERFKEDTQFLPDAYKDADAVAYIFYLINSQRADTLKEALNVYEEDLHRIKLQNMQQQGLEMQQHAIQVAENAERAALNAERNSSNAAFLSAMSFYNK